MLLVAVVKAVKVLLEGTFSILAALKQNLLTYVCFSCAEYDCRVTRIAVLKMGAINFG